MKRTAMTTAVLGFALMLSAQAQAGTKAADSGIGKLEAASLGKSSLGVLGDRGKALGKDGGQGSQNHGRGHSEDSPGHDGDHGSKSHGG